MFWFCKKGIYSSGYCAGFSPASLSAICLFAHGITVFLRAKLRKYSQCAIVFEEKLYFCTDFIAIFIMKKTFLIAAASSGSGKTTITMGLLRALSRRGYSVQPFKCGPDYIDPQYHRVACGKDSLNLDLWMNGEEAVCRLLNESSADINIIEGAMGLYDGAEGMNGSAAQVAETVGAEVILVVNGRSMAYSAAPLLYGYMHWRSKTRVRAVIFNHVGSKRHEQALRKAAEAVGLECLGCIPRQKNLYSPSRHLGLDLLERQRISELADNIADVIEENLSPLPFVTENVHSNTNITPSQCPPAQLVEKLYIAHDDAFNFLYPEAVQQLQRHFDVRFFSPLNNEPVGDDAAVVYLPGGYPELFLEQLSQSTATMESLRRTEARIIAECGGMMYLSKSIDGMPMTGLLPFSTTMENARLHLGYRQMLWHGEQLKGHEFHYSSLVSAPESDSQLFNAQGEAVDTLFYAQGNIIASYVHWSPVALTKLFLSN